MNSKEDLTVEIIIPTLNEEASIGDLIHSINKINIPQKISILVIDGGSKDNTVKICQELHVNTIQQKGRGKGTAMKEASQISQSDIIVFIDGDGTYSASDLPDLIRPLVENKSDMVVGSRTLGKREKGSITVFNTIGNKIFNRTINFAMKSKVTDSLTGYRAIWRELFNDLILFSSNFEIEVEMTVESLGSGYRVIEIPIKYGTRKGTPTKLAPVGDGLKIAKTLLFISMNMNPLKFFSLITLGFLVVGMIPGSQVIFEKITTGEIESFPSVVLSTLFFVTGALSFVVGLLSELVVRSRRRLEYIIFKRQHVNK
jgi:dolichol-phosphate hexosyltransferase